MNIINKLTLRQLKMNKKRTLVTIIGTIISAAMITAVATLGLSFMDIMQRQSIASGGEWHVKYCNVNQKQFNAISSNSKVKTTILSKELGYAKLEGSKNQNKPYLYVRELSKEGYEKFPIKLVQGKLPTKPNEIVITEEVRTNAGVNYKIGDHLQLAIGQRQSTAKDNKNSTNSLMGQTCSLLWENNKVAEELTSDFNKSYTIVGIIKRPSGEYNWSPGYTAITYVDKNAVSANDTIDVSVIFKKINTKLFDVADKIASDNGITDVTFNNDLLRYYGIYQDDSVKQMLYTLTAIILVIIMIGSVSLIYNAFAISVSERSRYLGMLSSVGATRSQKRNSVFFEGAVIGTISIPLGILAGYIGLGITYLCINPMIQGMLKVEEGFRLKVYPSSLITSILVSGITILISTYIPAKRASNISAIDAIRQVTDVKMKGKEVRTLAITRKIFGMEGDLGLKNLKRNRGRYKATVFSLIISMVLFLVVSSFTGYLKKSVQMTQDDINFDIQSILYEKDNIKKADIIKQITECNDIDEMTQYENVTASAWIDKNKAAEFLLKDKNAAFMNGRYLYCAQVDVLDNNSLKKYAKEAGLDYNQLTDTKHPCAVVINSVIYKDDKEGKYVETKIVKTNIGEKLDLLFTQGSENKKTSKEIKLPVKVAATTNKMPMGVMALGKTASFHVIMSEAAFNKMVSGKDISTSTKIYLNSKKPLKLQEELEKIQEEVGANTLSIINLYDIRLHNQQALLVVNVFTYAFIILITAICIANIINTISTSISLRKREFAMLKSIGITPKGFNKMLNYESLFYGIKALVYGLPLSILVMYLMYRVLMAKFDYDFFIPLTSIYIVIVAVFIIVGTAMLYSSSRVRKENIIDALKQESI